MNKSRGRVLAGAEGAATAENPSNASSKRTRGAVCLLSAASTLAGTVRSCDLGRDENMQHSQGIRGVWCQDGLCQPHLLF